MKGFGYILFFNLILCSAVLGEPKHIPDIGEHYPVFVFEKNENPQNIMVTYVKLDSSCKLVQEDAGRPFFDFYWLMDGARYKPVHPMIKSGIRDRLSIKSQDPDQSAFTLEITDISELRKDLKSTSVTVKARRNKETCEVEGVIELGDAMDEKLKLISVYSEARKTLLPPFRKVQAIEITGVSMEGEQKVTKRFKSM